MRTTILILLIISGIFSAQSRLDKLLGNSPLPAVVDHRISQTPVKNQAERGTCTAFAMTAALELFPGVPVDLSEQYLYASVKLKKYIDEKVVYEGETFESYIKVLENDGTVREEFEPYNPKSVLWTNEDNLMDKYTAEAGSTRIYDLFTGLFTVNSYRLRPNISTFIKGDEARHTIERIKSGLNDGILAIPVAYTLYIPLWAENEGVSATAFHPDKCLSVYFNDKFYSYSDAKKIYPDLADRILNNQMPVLQDTTSKHWGGHAVTIVGYNETGFIIKNSWGIDWGDEGYAIVSYDYHELFANEVFIPAMLEFHQALLDDDSPGFCDMDLKVVALRKEHGTMMKFSLIYAEDGKFPQLSSLNYKIYCKNNLTGIRKVLWEGPVLVGAFGKSWGYPLEALENLSCGMNGFDNSSIEVEASYQFKGSDRIFNKTFTGITYKTAQYKGK